MTDQQKAMWNATQEAFERYNKAIEHARHEAMRRYAQELGISEEAAEEQFAALIEDLSEKYRSSHH